MFGRLVFGMAHKTIFGAGVVEEGRLPGRGAVAQAAHARVMDGGHDLAVAVRAFMGSAPVVAVFVAISTEGGGVFAR